MSSPRVVTIDGIEWTQDELMDLIGLAARRDPARFPDFPSAAHTIAKSKAQVLIWESIAKGGAR